MPNRLKSGADNKDTGLALVLTLMLFATWNDLVQLRVFSFLKGLVT